MNGLIDFEEALKSYCESHLGNSTFTERTKLLQEGKDSANKFLTELTYNESSTITSISSTSSEIDSLDGLDGSCLPIPLPVRAPARNSHKKDNPEPL